MTATVLVTDAEFGKGKDVFEQACSDEVRFIPAPEDEQHLADAVRSSGARGVIVGVAKYTGALYDALPEGGIISRFGVGHDGVDKKRAKERGINVTNTPGVLDVSVAEHAMGLVSGLARISPLLSEKVRSGEWAPSRGVEMRGKILSLIGFGRIAKETAAIAARGYRMNIIACDNTPAHFHTSFVENLALESGVEVFFTSSVDKALEAGRFVSLHLPLLDATRGLISAERLLRMRPDSYLVNTARGGIVDEDALFDALSGGRLAGAAFDVFQNEPYAPISPERDLRTLPNFVMTPHISSNTDMSNQRMAERCVENVRALLEGRATDMDSVSV